MSSTESAAGQYEVWAPKGAPYFSYLLPGLNSYFSYWFHTHFVLISYYPFTDSSTQNTRDYTVNYIVEVRCASQYPI